MYVTYGPYHLKTPRLNQLSRVCNMFFTAQFLCISSLAISQESNDVTLRKDCVEQKRLSFRSWIHELGGSRVRSESIEECRRRNKIVIDRAVDSNWLVEEISDKSYREKLISASNDLTGNTEAFNQHDAYSEVQKASSSEKDTEKKDQGIDAIPGFIIRSH